MTSATVVEGAFSWIIILFLLLKIQLDLDPDNSLVVSGISFVILVEKL